MRSILLIVLLAVTAACAAPAFAERIAIIGTGQVATALGPRIAWAGHSVTYGSRNPNADHVQALLMTTGHGATASRPPNAAREADIIVLAVPAEVAVDVLSSLGDVAGKIIVDPTNAFEISQDRLARRTTDTSMGELLQAAAPAARVVKALNSISYRTMKDPDIARGTITIPMAGNDERAKRRVAALLGELGFESLDIGPVRYSRELEGMLIVWMNARLSGNSFNYYFRPENGEE